MHLQSDTSGAKMYEVERMTKAHERRLLLAHVCVQRTLLRDVPSALFHEEHT